MMNKEKYTNLNDAVASIRNTVIANTNNIKWSNTTIEFSGSNNTLYISDPAIITDSRFIFEGDNSVLYISKTHIDVSLFAALYNGSSIFIGKNNFFNRFKNNIMHIYATEQQNVIIGNNNLFSFGAFIRTQDAHLIYDIHTNQRINFSKDVVIGDHCWIGQNVTFLKGTILHSGSIIGASSVVSGKAIPSNQIWAGNPAKCIKRNIYWCGVSTLNFKAEDTDRFLKFKNPDDHKFKEDIYTLDVKNINMPFVELESYNKHNRFSKDDDTAYSILKSYIIKLACILRNLLTR